MSFLIQLMTSKISQFICILFFFHSLNAQEVNSCIQFRPVFQNQTIELYKTYFQVGTKDSVRVEKIKFYISDILFLLDSVVVDSVKQKFWLMDADKPKGLLIPFTSSAKFNQIAFSIGIDSITNVSGALGGDLDPTKGMYWTWQSGYVNFKLEGHSSASAEENGGFQFHIGGYQYPYYMIQKVHLATHSNQRISVDVDLQKLLNKIDLSKTFQAMSPSQKALEIAKKLPSIFAISDER